MTPYVLVTIGIVVTVIGIVAAIRSIITHYRNKRVARQVAYHTACIARILEEENGRSGSPLYQELNEVGSILRRVRFLVAFLGSKNPQEFERFAPGMTLSWIVTARRELERIYQATEQDLDKYVLRERSLITYHLQSWTETRAIIWREKEPLILANKTARERRDTLKAAMDFCKILPDVRPPLFYPQVDKVHA